MRSILLLTLFALPAGYSAADEPKLAYPIIAGYGGVVVLPKAAEQPRKGAKVVFDISIDAKANEANKGLVRVARLLNLYGAAGMTAADVRIALVVHGEATRSALSEAVYKSKFGVDNPNLPLIAALRKSGIEVFVCGQALYTKGFAEGEVAKDVTLADAALTVVINRQADGFALIQVP